LALYATRGVPDPDPAPLLSPAPAMSIAPVPFNSSFARENADRSADDAAPNPFSPRVSGRRTEIEEPGNSGLRL